LEIKKNQFESLTGSQKRDFLLRLDQLLLPHSESYAATPTEKRLEALSMVVNNAEGYGIREELNLGLFALAMLVFGVATLRAAETQSILTDPHRTGAAKVFQLWVWCRKQFPDAAVFKGQ
jgi:hypothetical protein